MSRERYTNASPTTLNGAINNSVTTVVVTDGSTFPTSFFRVIVGSEIMLCTARSGNTLTVLRGQEGSTAATHIDTAPANHIITAGALSQFRKDILADIGMIDSSDSLSADDDDFDDENFSGWTTVQSSPNCTVTEKNHRCSIYIPNGTANAQHYAFLKAKVPSAGDWVQAGWQLGSPSGQYPIPGIMITNGVTYGSGKQLQFAYSINENSFFMRGTAGFNSQSDGEGGGGGQNPWWWPHMHIRLVWNSTNNYSAYCSCDAITWGRVFNGAGYGGVGTPTHMGFSTTSWGSANQNAQSCLYCRFSF